METDLDRLDNLPCLPIDLKGAKQRICEVIKRKSRFDKNDCLGWDADDFGPIRSVHVLDARGLKWATEFISNAATKSKNLTLPLSHLIASLIEEAMIPYAIAVGVVSKWLYYPDFCNVFVETAYEMLQVSGRRRLPRQQVADRVDFVYPGCMLRIRVEMVGQHVVKRLFGHAPKKIRKKLYEALNRSHYKAFEAVLGPHDIETFRSLTPPSPKVEEERMKFFMERWAHVFLRRAWGACKLSSGENVLNVKKVILLFDTLLSPFSHQGIQWSCVPVELTKVNGLPPKDWSILPTLVRLEMFKDEPKKRKASAAKKRKKDRCGNEDSESSSDNEDLLLPMMWL